MDDHQLQKLITALDKRDEKRLKQLAETLEKRDEKRFKQLINCLKDQDERRFKQLIEVFNTQYDKFDQRTSQSEQRMTSLANKIYDLMDAMYKELTTIRTEQVVMNQRFDDI